MKKHHINKSIDDFQYHMTKGGAIYFGEGYYDDNGNTILPLDYYRLYIWYPCPKCGSRNLSDKLVEGDTIGVVYCKDCGFEGKRMTNSDGENWID